MHSLGGPQPTSPNDDPFPYTVRFEQLETHVAQAQPAISGIPYGPLYCAVATVRTLTGLADVAVRGRSAVAGALAGCGAELGATRGVSGMLVRAPAVHADRATAEAAMADDDGAVSDAVVTMLALIVAATMKPHSDWVNRRREHAGKSITAYIHGHMRTRPRHARNVVATTRCAHRANADLRSQNSLQRRVTNVRMKVSQPGCPCRERI